MVLKSDDDTQTYADPDPLSVCKEDNLAIFINYDSSNGKISLPSKLTMCASA